MFRKILLTVFALAGAATAAGAADLPAQSRVGAIFAEPAEVRAYTYRSREYSAPIIAYNLLPDPNRGGDGSSWSYYYPGPYYGGPYDGDGARLPYVCGLYGYC